MVQESRWPDGETIGARSRQLQGKEHCMPPALTGQSCVTWRIADDPAADDEQGRGLELLDGLTNLNGGARGVVDDTDGPGKTVYVVLSLYPSQASIR